MEMGDVQFLPAVKALFHDLEEHFQEEESQNLIALEAALGDGQSQDLAQSFERAKAACLTAKACT